MQKLIKDKQMKLLTIIIILFSTNLFAKSLEWQKMDLEESLQAKYNDAISSVLKKDEFFIVTEVKYNDPGMPDFNDLNETDFKVSDIAFDDSKGDYIAFSKVGLEVPVLGKAYKENQRKLKEMYRYNESFDLFKNIQSVDVIVNISDTVNQSKIALIKTITDNLKFSIFNFTPKVEIKTLKIKEILDVNGVKPEEGVTSRDLIELLGKFGNAIGMIVTVLLLGFLAYKLLKMYMDFMEKFQPKQNEETKDEAGQDEDESSKEINLNLNNPDSDSMSDIEGEELPSFERFQKLINLNIDQAVILVKKWIFAKTDNSAMALSAVAQQLEHEQLDTLFSKLSSQEREGWNSSLVGYLDHEKLEVANKIISEEVIKEVVGGSPINDFELIDTILNMDIKSVKNYILKNEKYGKVLSNLINPGLLTDLMNGLEENEIEAIISQSFDFNINSLDSILGEFKADLKSFSKSNQVNPFNTKLLNVISEVSVQKEQILYNHLVKESDIKSILAIAKKYIPGELVLDLPVTFLKQTMQNYPLNKKVNLIASMNEDDQMKLMDSFTEEGSSAREMIVMELETLKENDLEYARVKKQKNDLWQEFVNFTRKAVESDDSIQSDVEYLVDNWLKSLKDEKTQNLKVS